MSTRQLLIDSATRIFSDHCDKALLDSAEAGHFPHQLLKVLRTNGLHEIGGVDSGVPLDEVFAVLEVAGQFAAPLPLAELIFAARWDTDSGEFTSIGRFENSDVVDVPWGRIADGVLGVSVQGQVYRLQPTQLREQRNLAGEPRDRISAEGAVRLPVTEPAFALMALSRVALMTGALRRVLELSLQYAGEREQFGRPIAKFQAIQHYLAQMAAEVAAAGRAASAAADAAATQLGDARFVLEVAAAKSRVGEAVGYVVETAHQIHGAMGYTHEHQLHHYTRRLWTWRDEFGNERYWQERLGAEVAALGADALWNFVATRA